MKDLYDEGIPDGLSVTDAKVLLALPLRGYSNRRQVIHINIEQMDKTQLPKVRRTSVWESVRDTLFVAGLALITAFIVYQAFNVWSFLF